MDFIAEYGAEFGIADTNLHGDNGMKFTEYVVRIETVDQALRMMVLNKWITVSVGDAGYLFRIAPAGTKLAEKFQTSYAYMYRNIANVSYAKYGHMSVQELDTMINQRSVAAAKENGL